MAGGHYDKWLNYTSDFRSGFGRTPTTSAWRASWGSAQVCSEHGGRRGTDPKLLCICEGAPPRFPSARPPVRPPTPAGAIPRTSTRAVSRGPTGGPAPARSGVAPV